MRLKLHLNKLFLKQKFTIQHGSYNYRHQLIVELQHEGHSGFGETIAIDYYGIKIEELQEAASTIKENIESFDIAASPMVFYGHLFTLLPDNPFLRCAFDEAYIDLQSKIMQISVRDFLQISDTTETCSSITIGLSDSMESISEKLDDLWPFYKVKVSAIDQREEVLKMISDAGKSFGIDANGGLDLGQAQKLCELVYDFGGQYVEQLFSKNNTDDLARLKVPTGLLHFADESIVDLASAKSLAKHYDGFVLKLTKCGGFTPTMEIIEFCKQNHLAILAGCMTESSFGINHMVALLPLFDYADLDGAFLISNDEEIREIDSISKRILHTDGYFH